MLEYTHLLETRGRYRLVAVTHSPVYAPGDVVGHVVISDDGDRLTDLMSLSEARQHLEALSREQGLEPKPEGESIPRKKASRRRRR